jgi:hypothetical protein
MLIPKPNIVPPGGWKITLGDIEIIGNGFPDLVHRMTAYYVNRGLPIGDLMGEISRQICGQYPDYCVDNGNTSTGAGRFSYADIFDQITEWHREIDTAHVVPTLVDQNTAELRAQTCAACPFNVNNIAGKHGCKTCGGNDPITPKSQDIVGGKKLKAKVGGCSILAVDNNAACFMHRNNLLITDAQIEKLPRFCHFK